METLYYNKKNKKALEVAIADRLYVLKQVTKHFKREEWEKDIKGLEKMLRQLYGIEKDEKL